MPGTSTECIRKKKPRKSRKKRRKYSSRKNPKKALNFFRNTDEGSAGQDESRDSSSVSGTKDEMENLCDGYVEVKLPRTGGRLLRIPKIKSSVFPPDVIQRLRILCTRFCSHCKRSTVLPVKGSLNINNENYSLNNLDFLKEFFEKSHVHGKIRYYIAQTTITSVCDGSGTTKSCGDDSPSITSVREGTTAQLTSVLCPSSFTDGVGTALFNTAGRGDAVKDGAALSSTQFRTGNTLSDIWVCEGDGPSGMDIVDGVNVFTSDVPASVGNYTLHSIGRIITALPGTSVKISTAQSEAADRENQNPFRTTGTEVSAPSVTTAGVGLIPSASSVPAGAMKSVSVSSDVINKVVSLPAGFINKVANLKSDAKNRVITVPSASTGTLVHIPSDTSDTASKVASGTPRVQKFPLDTELEAQVVPFDTPVKFSPVAISAVDSAAQPVTTGQNRTAHSSVMGEVCGGPPVKKGGIFVASFARMPRDDVAPSVPTCRASTLPPTPTGSVSITPSATAGRVSKTVGVSMSPNATASKFMAPCPTTKEVVMASCDTTRRTIIPPCDTTSISVMAPCATTSKAPCDTISGIVTASCATTCAILTATSTAMSRGGIASLTTMSRLGMTPHNTIDKVSLTPTTTVDTCSMNPPTTTTNKFGMTPSIVRDRLSRDLSSPVSSGSFSTASSVLRGVNIQTPLGKISTDPSFVMADQTLSYVKANSSLSFVKADPCPKSKLGKVDTTTSLVNAATTSLITCSSASGVNRVGVLKTPSAHKICIGAAPEVEDANPPSTLKADATIGPSISKDGKPTTSPVPTCKYILLPPSSFTNFTKISNLNKIAGKTVIPVSKAGDIAALSPTKVGEIIVSAPTKFGDDVVPLTAKVGDGVAPLSTKVGNGVLANATNVVGGMVQPTKVGDDRLRLSSKIRHLKIPGIINVREVVFPEKTQVKDFVSSSAKVEDVVVQAAVKVGNVVPSASRILNVVDSVASKVQSSVVPVAAKPTNVMVPLTTKAGEGLALHTKRVGDCVVSPSTKISDGIIPPTTKVGDCITPPTMKGRDGVFPPSTKVGDNVLLSTNKVKYVMVPGAINVSEGVFHVTNKVRDESSSTAKVRDLSVQSAAKAGNVVPSVNRILNIDTSDSRVQSLVVSATAKMKTVTVPFTAKVGEGVVPPMKKAGDGMAPATIRVLDSTVQLTKRVVDGVAPTTKRIVGNVMPPTKRIVDDNVPPTKRALEDFSPAKRFADDVPPAKRAVESIVPITKRIVDDDVPPTKRVLYDVAPAKRVVDDVPPAKCVVDDVPPTKRVVDDVPPAKRVVDDVPPARRIVDVVVPPTKRIVDGTVPPTKRLGNGVAPCAKNLGDGAAPPTKKFGDGVPQPTKKVGDGVAPPTRTIEDSVAPPAKKFGDGVTSPTKKVGDGVTSPAKKVGDCVTSPDKKVGDGMAPLTKKVGDGMVVPTKKVDDGVPMPTNKVGNGLALPAKKVGGDIAPPTKKVGDGVARPTKGARNSMVSPPKKVEDDMVSPTKKVGDVISPKKNVENGVVSPTRRVGDDVFSPTKNVGDAVVSSTKNVGNPMVSPIKNVADAMVSPTEKVGEGMVAATKEFGNDMVTTNTKVGEGMVSPTNNVGSDVMQSTTKVGDSVVPPASKVGYVIAKSTKDRDMYSSATKVVDFIVSSDSKARQVISPSAKLVGSPTASASSSSQSNAIMAQSATQVRATADPSDDQVRTATSLLSIQVGATAAMSAAQGRKGSDPSSRHVKGTTASSTAQFSGTKTLSTATKFRIAVNQSAFSVKNPENPSAAAHSVCTALSATKIRATIDPSAAQAVDNKELAHLPYTVVDEKLSSVPNQGVEVFSGTVGGVSSQPSCKPDRVNTSLRANVGPFDSGPSVATTNKIGPRRMRNDGHTCAGPHLEGTIIFTDHVNYYYNDCASCVEDVQKLELSTLSIFEVKIDNKGGVTNSQTDVTHKKTLKMVYSADKIESLKECQTKYHKTKTSVDSATNIESEKVEPAVGNLDNVNTEADTESVDTCNSEPTKIDVEIDPSEIKLETDDHLTEAGENKETGENNSDTAQLTNTDASNTEIAVANTEPMKSSNIKFSGTHIEHTEAGNSECVTAQIKPMDVKKTKNPQIHIGSTEVANIKNPRACIQSMEITDTVCPGTQNDSTEISNTKCQRTHIDPMAATNTVSERAHIEPSETIRTGFLRTQTGPLETGFIAHAELCNILPIAPETVIGYPVTQVGLCLFPTEIGFSMPIKSETREIGVQVTPYVEGDINSSTNEDEKTNDNFSEIEEEISINLAESRLSADKTDSSEINRSVVQGSTVGISSMKNYKVPCVAVATKGTQTDCPHARLYPTLTQTQSVSEIKTNSTPILSTENRHSISYDSATDTIKRNCSLTVTDVTNRCGNCNECHILNVVKIVKHAKVITKPVLDLVPYLGGKKIKNEEISDEETETPSSLLNVTTDQLTDSVSEGGGFSVINSEENGGMQCGGVKHGNSELNTDLCDTEKKQGGCNEKLDKNSRGEVLSVKESPVILLVPQTDKDLAINRGSAHVYTNKWETVFDASSIDDNNSGVKQLLQTGCEVEVTNYKKKILSSTSAEEVGKSLHMDNDSKGFQSFPTQAKLEKKVADKIIQDISQKNDGCTESLTGIMSQSANIECGTKLSAGKVEEKDDHHANPITHSLPESKINLTSSGGYETKRGDCLKEIQDQHGHYLHTMEKQSLRKSLPSEMEKIINHNKACICILCREPKDKSLTRHLDRALIDIIPEELPKEVQTVHETKNSRTQTIIYSFTRERKNLRNTSRKTCLIDDILDEFYTKELKSTRKSSASIDNVSQYVKRKRKLDLCQSDNPASNTPAKKNRKYVTCKKTKARRKQDLSQVRIEDNSYVLQNMPQNNTSEQIATNFTAVESTRSSKTLTRGSSVKLTSKDVLNTSKKRGREQNLPDHVGSKRARMLENNPAKYPKDNVKNYNNRSADKTAGPSKRNLDRPSADCIPDDVPLCCLRKSSKSINCVHTSVADTEKAETSEGTVEGSGMESLPSQDKLNVNVPKENVGKEMAKEGSKMIKK